MRFVVLPGDGIGPEISEATIQVLEVLNRKLALGISFETHEIGLSRLAKDGSTFPDEVLGGGARGGRDHPRAGLALGLPAARAGRHQRLGASAGAARPLRQHPPLPLARGAGALRPDAARPRHRAREHRRLLRRPDDVHGHGRVHADAGRRHRHAQGDGQGLAAHRQGRLRARADPAAAQADLRAQGQRAEDVGRAVSQGVPGRREGLPGRRHRRPADRLDDRDAGARRAALRRRRHHQHVRRHPLGPRLGALGQPRARRRDQRRRRALHGAGAARLGARHRRARTRRTRARWCCRRRCCSTGSRTSAGFPSFRRGAEAINRAVDELVKRPGDADPRPRRQARHPRLHRERSATRSSGASEVPLRFCANLDRSSSRSCRCSTGSRRRPKAGFRGVELLAPYEAPATAIRAAAGRRRD